MWLVQHAKYKDVKKPNNCYLKLSARAEFSANIHFALPPHTKAGKVDSKVQALLLQRKRRNETQSLTVAVFPQNLKDQVLGHLCYTSNMQTIHAASPKPTYLFCPYSTTPKHHNEQQNRAHTSIAIHCTMSIKKMKWLINS